MAIENATRLLSEAAEGLRQETQSPGDKKKLLDGSRGACVHACVYVCMCLVLICKISRSLAGNMYLSVYMCMYMYQYRNLTFLNIIILISKGYIFLRG